MIPKKTKKCEFCGKRYKLHDWQTGIETKWCFTCCVCFNFAIDKILTPRYRKVMKMRLGLENGKVYTYKKIGEEFGVTPERIRQMFYHGIDEIICLREMLNKTKESNGTN